MSKRTFEEALETKNKILSAAINILANEGYDKLSLNKLAILCEVTRGAVYHHFDSKEDLFLEAVKSILLEMNLIIEQSAQSKMNPMDSLLRGTKSFLKESQSKKYQRIILLDAPAVLGIKRWQKIDDEYTTSTLVEVFSELKRDDLNYDVTILAQIFSGAMNQLSLWISNDNDVQMAYDHLEKMIISFFKI